MTCTLKGVLALSLIPASHTKWSDEETNTATITFIHSCDYRSHGSHLPSLLFACCLKSVLCSLMKGEMSDLMCF